MNILYLIGNGFDVSLGMRTRYENFYDTYCSLPDSEQNKRVCDLKDEIQADKDNWADLEWAFGQFTVKLSSFDEFEGVYYDLSDALVRYLREEEKKLDVSRLSREEFLYDLSKPSSSLTPADRARISLGNSNVQNSINIISFNYTHTIESLLDLENEVSIQGKTPDGKIPWRFERILHVHGTIDEGSTILLGVNDASQVANPDFAKDEAITDILVKPSSNRVLKENTDVYCKRLIQAADIIVLFGLSVGSTDALWWHEIVERLSSSNAILILYHYDKKLNIGPNRGQRLGAIERQVRAHFLKQAGSNTPESRMREKIYVGVNTRMFSRVKK